MTIYPDKTAPATPVVNRRDDLAWLNVLMPILLAATILPLPGGADGIHCVGGMLLLTACVIHLIWHRRWIKAVVLGRPTNITPALRRQRRLFWAMLLSGLLCGSSGLNTLLFAHAFLPLLCLVVPIHALSGLAFLGLSIYHLVLHRNWFTTKIGRVFHGVRK